MNGVKENKILVLHWWNHTAASGCLGVRSPWERKFENGFFLLFGIHTEMCIVYTIVEYEHLELYRKYFWCEHTQSVSIYRCYLFHIIYKMLYYARTEKNIMAKGKWWRFGDSLCNYAFQWENWVLFYSSSWNFGF